jgi:hypothetical protein
MVAVVAAVVPTPPELFLLFMWVAAVDAAAAVVAVADGPISG